MSAASDSTGKQNSATRRWIAPRSGGYHPGEFSSKSVSVPENAVPPAGDGGVSQAAGRSRERS